MSLKIKCLVLGGKGQLGQAFLAVVGEFADAFSDVILHYPKPALDITQPGLVSEFLAHNPMDVIINCAAYTQVDQAECDATQANLVNHLAVRDLAQIVKNQGGFLVHFSTDYVFDGQHKIPYSEQDAPKPINQYGVSKLKGEQAMLAINPPGLVVRTSGLFSPFGRNFVTTILRLAQQQTTLNVVEDQVFSPTSALDLAHAILTLLRTRHLQQTQNRLDQAWLHTQLLHFANQGQANWAQLASCVVQHAKLNCKVHSISSQQYASTVNRPAYSVLNTQRLQAMLNTPIRPWQNALHQTLDRMLIEPPN